ncbi:hypothetical protein BS47DRAFT_592215 [Hydnum rufescens UP504]|uniref:Homeobox domain-containing protein n=1 Tax=Hydnum rufescens UP504 TaxID=1448309 RepID=A0A9P6B3Q3_9AGAM|nr:hypothetical protein BS47DRAFT_592215 [Hydnum rufescens UP504]
MKHFTEDQEADAVQADSPPHSASEGDAEGHSGSTTAAGPARSTSAKRKRGRVNPTQLAHLERAYAKDRSLDAARRKEISEALGMEERQTQIWFQNRRAKAKLLEQRARFNQLATSDSSDAPQRAPALSLDPPAKDIKNVLQEEDPISIIPCTDLFIGTWRRINSAGLDLIAYTCDTKRILTWFIHSAGVGFKMKIPYDTISVIEYQRHTTPGQDRASIIINKPPTFYREVTSHVGGVATKIWRPAYDWTEGAQASICTRHEIIGPAGQLAYSLRSLPGFESFPSPSLSFSSSTDTLSSISPKSPPQYLLSRPSSAGTGFKAAQIKHTRARSRSSPSPLPTMTFTLDYPSSAGPTDQTNSLSDLGLLPRRSQTLPSNDRVPQSGEMIMPPDPFGIPDNSPRFRSDRRTGLNGALGFGGLDQSLQITPLTPRIPAPDPKDMSPPMFDQTLLGVIPVSLMSVRRIPSPA